MDSPLHRTWRRFSLNGSISRNAAHVSGAFSVSSRALEFVRAGDDQQVRHSVMAGLKPCATDTNCDRHQLRPIPIFGVAAFTRSPDERTRPCVSATIFPSRKIVSPRRIVRTTTPMNSNPRYGLILCRWNSCAGSSVYEREGSSSSRSASFPRFSVPFEGIRKRAAGFAASEPGDVLEPEAAAVEPALEEHGKRRLHAGHASPRRAEITLLLQRRIGRRMIRGNQIDLAIEDLLPQLRVLVQHRAAAARIWQPRRWARDRPR